MKKASRDRILTVGGILFIVLSALFLGKSFVDGVHEAGGLRNLLHFNVPLFLTSSLLLAGHLVLAGYTWSLVTTVSGGNLDFKKGFSIHFLSQIGKYVPGKVWAAMGKYTLSRNSGLTNLQTGQGLVFETVFIVLASLINTLPLLPPVVSEAGMSLGLGMTVAAGTAVFLLFCLHPAVFGRLAGFAAKIMKTEYRIRNAGFSEMLRLLLAYLAVFLMLGTAFWLLSLSFGLNMPFYPGIFVYPAAMGVGYLAVFTPGGLGAREITTVWLIHLVVPNCEPGLAELTTIVARLWITVGEAAAFGVSFPLYGVTPARLRGMLAGGSGSADRDTVQ